MTTWLAVTDWRDLALVHQLFVQAAGFAATQNIGGHVQLGIAGLEHGGGVPGIVHARQLDAVGASARVSLRSARAARPPRGARVHRP